MSTTPRRNRRVAVSAVVVALVLASCGGGNSDAKGGTEVFLEPVGKAGRDPFTKTVALPTSDTTVTTAAPPVTATGTAIPSSDGSSPGLYGGTRNESSCDKEQLVAFLDANTDKATAWAGVLGIRVDQVRKYVTGLTPVVLVHDTRVTNHGFANGHATSRAAVLQAGTAVMVDSFGVPRVKCGCGNPLTEPVAVSNPVYAGPEWTDFVPATTVVVVASAAVITVIVLVDVDTGSLFGRPAGTDGSNDVDVTPEGQPTGINDVTLSGTFTVEFQGDLSGPCQAWPTGTGSMTVTATEGALSIALTYPSGVMYNYVGNYNPVDGHWVAPDVQFGRNPLGGTFTIVDGVVTVPDGLRTTQNVHGDPCVGGFTATKTA